jgi:mannose-1-phosphate guanylyltransferase
MKSKPDNKDRYVIIMAGGRGERFWPVSREKTPKQLLALLGRRRRSQSNSRNCRGKTSSPNRSGATPARRLR